MLKAASFSSVALIILQQSNQYIYIKYGSNNYNDYMNVKGVVCSSDPTEVYHLTLKESFLASFRLLVFCNFTVLFHPQSSDKTTARYLPNAEVPVERRVLSYLLDIT